MAQITVLGAGGFGMALSLLAYNKGHTVSLWSPFEDEVASLIKNHGNEKLLSGITLPAEINITSDITCVKGSAVTIIAVPSGAVRSVTKKLSAMSDFGIIANVAKGFEKGTLYRLSQVISDEIPTAQVVALSGPSHAEEVSRSIPTSVVAASRSPLSAEIVQDILSDDNFRIYTSSDVIGVELGGALKNVIAVAAGMCDGLGLGDNSKAALITRGLAEMARLGVCMGAEEYTFAGLTGIGDLVVTCTSRHSRNNRFGNMVGKGVPIEAALKEVGTVEGYYAADTANSLADKYNIEMPIIRECYSVLYKNQPVNQVVSHLMCRPQRSEH